MGLDANVHCNCWKEGKAKPPPFPIVWNLIEGPIAAEISVDADFAKRTQLAVSLHDWMHDACLHKNMDFASVHVGNWPSYRAFQGALEQANWLNFPTLKRVLPETNSGSAPAEAATKCLEELDRFKTLVGQGTTTDLVNSETREVLRSYIAAYRGVFSWDLDADGRVTIGIDPHGFFIKSMANDQELFRAIRLEIQPLDEGQAEYFDAETDRRFIGKHYKTLPRTLHVEQRQSQLDDHRYTVEALERMFLASVETGNPVLWG